MLNSLLEFFKIVILLCFIGGGVCYYIFNIKFDQLDKYVINCLYKWESSIEFECTYNNLEGDNICIHNVCNEVEFSFNRSKIYFIKNWSYFFYIMIILRMVNFIVIHLSLFLGLFYILGEYVGYKEMLELFKKKLELIFMRLFSFIFLFLIAYSLGIFKYFIFIYILDIFGFLILFYLFLRNNFFYKESFGIKEVFYWGLVYYCLQKHYYNYHMNDYLLNKMIISVCKNRVHVLSRIKSLWFEKVMKKDLLFKEKKIGKYKYLLILFYEFILIIIFFRFIKLVSCEKFSDFLYHILQFLIYGVLIHILIGLNVMNIIILFNLFILYKVSIFFVREKFNLMGLIESLRSCLKEYKEEIDNYILRVNINLNNDE